MTRVEQRRESMSSENTTRGEIPGSLIDFPCSQTWAEYYKEKGLGDPTITVLLDLVQEMKRLSSGGRDARSTNYRKL
jgi:hypothetical protein